MLQSWKCLLLMHRYSVCVIFHIYIWYIYISKSKTQTLRKKWESNMETKTCQGSSSPVNTQLDFLCCLPPKKHGAKHDLFWEESNICGVFICASHVLINRLLMFMSKLQGVLHIGDIQLDHTSLQTCIDNEPVLYNVCSCCFFMAVKLCFIDI